MKTESEHIKMDLKLSPKLIALCEWEKISEVNARLDNKESPNQVYQFIKKSGFAISLPLVYEYAKTRKKAQVQGISMEYLITVNSQNRILDKTDPATITATNKLRSELDALDKVIQSGYDTLTKYADQPIAPRIMMEAIKLKYVLTDGNNGFLTNYGLEELKQIEQEKFKLIIEHLLNYIPENKRKEALDKIDSIEEEYYKKTAYYKEYLKAKGLKEDEITARMEALTKL